MTDEAHTTGETREYDVLLRLSPVRNVRANDLASTAERILEAVETYAKSCVDGPAVGYTLDPQEIRLDFTTEADSQDELQRTIGHVSQVIVNETGLRFEVSRQSELAAR